MYAIVEINGHQFKVEAGKKLFVDHLAGAESGERRYVACGNVENGERINAFGEFSED